MARGWALVAQGEHAKAAALARTLLPRFPRSSAVLVLAVDAELAAGGPSAALDTYERWLGARKLEDGYTLRRIARAVLQDATGGPESPVRQLALDALAADGDQRTTPSAQPGADAQADKLVTALSSPAANRAVVIAALGGTGSRRAVAPITGVLTDPDPMVRAAAAEALGQLGGKEAVPGLKPLLDDPVFTVKLNAAASLLQLGDTSGLAWLRDLQSSEHAGVRLASARATRSQADPAWINSVRSLAGDADPDVRREAAELLAPHDPEAARTAIEALMTDPNPAERDAAAQAFVRFVATDFAALRSYLRSTDVAMRARAGARVLELTR